MIELNPMYIAPALLGLSLAVWFISVIRKTSNPDVALVTKRRIFCTIGFIGMVLGATAAGCGLGACGQEEVARELPGMVIGALITGGSMFAIVSLIIMVVGFSWDFDI